MLYKRIKIPIRMQQRNILVNAIGRNVTIYRFADGDSLFPEKTIILCGL